MKEISLFLRMKLEYLNMLVEILLKNNLKYQKQSFNLSLLLLVILRKLEVFFIKQELNTLFVLDKTNQYQMKHRLHFHKNFIKSYLVNQKQFVLLFKWQKRVLDHMKKNPLEVNLANL